MKKFESAAETVTAITAIGSTKNNFFFIKVFLKVYLARTPTDNAYTEPRMRFESSPTANVLV